MARRAPQLPGNVRVTGAARTPTERPSVVQSSLYLPEPVYEVLRHRSAANDDNVEFIAHDHLSTYLTVSR
jgi:hypothetical protein